MSINFEKKRMAVCTWSLQNDPARVAAVMQTSGLKSLHLDVGAYDVFSGLIESNEWEISAMMVNFPQEDYSTLESIRVTGGIVPDSHWPENRRRALDAIGLTGELAVSFLTTHVGFIETQEVDAHAVFTERLIELADAAAAAGIMLLLETGQETSSELKHVLESMNHPALGVNFDPANMILYGKGDPIEAVEVLAPWIRHVHLKDAIPSKMEGEWGTEVPWGDGAVGTEAFLKKLDAIGYTGQVAVEREAGDCREADIVAAVERTLSI